MPLPNGLGTAKPLSYFIDHIDEQTFGWLYIRGDTDAIELSMDCYPAEIDSRDVSEEEMDALHSAWHAAGFQSFLCDDQIQEIIGNLDQQRSDYTPADLERAIDFFWKHDAFIALDDELN